MTDATLPGGRWVNPPGYVWITSWSGGRAGPDQEGSRPVQEGGVAVTFPAGLPLFAVATICRRDAGVSGVLWLP